MATETKAMRIGNLVTDLHNVLNGFYNTDLARRKAIRNAVEKIYNSGFEDGYTEGRNDMQYDMELSAAENS